MVARRELRRPAIQLPQRTLRNEISRVLRDVEAGDSFAITVNGRVVAELGPPRDRPHGVDWKTAHALIAKARRHADPELWALVKEGRSRHEEDAWTRAERRST